MTPPNPPDLSAPVLPGTVPTPADTRRAPPPAPNRGVYAISVAAELAGSGIQALRLYERRGLLAPDRTNAGTRRYSEDDLDRVRRITDLLSAGLNLAGIGVVLELEAENAALRAELDAARARLGSAR